MDATDWLAPVAGGLNAVTDRRNRLEDQGLEREKMRSQEKMADVRAEVQRMLAAIRADTSTGNNVNTNTTRERIAGLTEGGKNTRAGQSDATRRRGQDIGAETTRRGQDITSEDYWDSAARDWSKTLMTDKTRRRGQDISSADSRYGVDTRDEQSANALRARNALGVLSLRARRRPSLLSDAPPEDFAAEFDKLYNSPDDATSEALSGAGGPDASGDVQIPPTSGAPRPAVPVPVRQPAAAAPQAGALEGQARQLMQTIRTKEAAGQDATAERTQLAALRAQVK